MNKLKLNISLVIPCFNEEGNINSLINKSKNFLRNKNKQLILVNNGSTDNTKKKILSYVKKYRNIYFVNINKNIGFGYGLKKGLEKGKNSGKQCSRYCHIGMDYCLIHNKKHKELEIINNNNIDKDE